jgi:putative transposase
MISHYKQFRTDSLRLHNHDYTQPGYYFITLCINNRERLFGFISQRNIVLNEYGFIVEKCWLDLPNHYQNMKLNAYMVMPNHFHGIIQIIDTVETGLKPISTGTTQIKPDKYHGLSEFVRALKTFSSRRINELRHTIGKNIWQYGYYDHVIRNNESLQRIRAYIMNNPANWKNDRFYQL